MSTELCHKNSMLGSQHGPLRNSSTSFLVKRIPNKVLIHLVLMMSDKELDYII